MLALPLAGGEESIRRSRSLKAGMDSMNVDRANAATAAVNLFPMSPLRKCTGGPFPAAVHKESLGNKLRRVKRRPPPHSPQTSPKEIPVLIVSEPTASTTNNENATNDPKVLEPLEVTEDAAPRRQSRDSVHPTTPANECKLKLRQVTIDSTILPNGCHLQWKS